jgi:predicted nucleic-acid-binding protein
VKITPDTNILVRAIVGDDPRESRAARSVLDRAELIALTVPTLCELVWVLSRGYRIGKDDLTEAIRRLADSANVAVDRAALEAGFVMLQAGGDFADGAIAYQGRWLGGEVFVSFDRKAVKLLAAQGKKASIPR